VLAHAVCIHRDYHGELLHFDHPHRFRDAKLFELVNTQNALYCLDKEGSRARRRWTRLSLGDDFDPKKANTKEAKLGDTSDVGKFLPQGDSPYGCADMSGNVWEWCNDRLNGDEYKNREGRIVKDPHGPEGGETRSLRGGSWLDSEISARVSFRNGSHPGYRYNDIGFRVVVFPSG
jgi:formylglycine-generating enzyme required for sulfatase activity